MDLLEKLKKEYGGAGFTNRETNDSLVFLKVYSFKDSDGTNKEVLIEVFFSKEYPVIPPQIHDPGHVLSSMHSLNGFQCWARFSEIFPQVGLGLIAPAFVDTQIKRLIDAHITREYYTINESPEFASIFEARNAVDHMQIYLSCEVLDEVVKKGQGKIISSVANITPNSLYGVNEAPASADSSTHIIPPPINGGKRRRVFFLNVPAVQHYDYRNDDIGFLYWLELASGISQKDTFLLSIKEEIYVVLVFPNKGLNSHDIVVFRKKENKLTLLPHARVSSRYVLFSRHAREFEQFANKKIALIGIGAIGSLIGMNLLQSGIDRLLIADNDYVDLENTSRSVYCEEDVGKKKSEAFKYRALKKDIDFGNRVVICETLEKVDKESVDIIVICIGDLYQEYMISRKMRKNGFEKIVFVFGQNDSTWGGVYFQDDPLLGCQHCLLLHQAEKEYLRIPYVPYFSEAVGCGDPSYISTPTDIGMIANLASKLIIERLIRRQKTGPNYFIWQSNPDPIAWRDSHPDRYSLKKYRVLKHESCEC